MRLKCSQWTNGKCSREATYISARAIDGFKKFYNDKELTFPDAGAVITDHLFCNIHKGAELRKASRPGGYGQIGFYTLGFPGAAEVMKKVRFEQEKREAARAMQQEADHARATEASKGSNMRKWAENQRTPSVERKFEDTEGYQSVTTLSVSFDNERDWDRRNFEVIDRTIRPDDTWYSIAPGFIRANTNREMTAAEARAVAEALLMAARELDAINLTRAAVRTIRLAKD